MGIHQLFALVEPPLLCRSDVLYGILCLLLQLEDFPPVPGWIVGLCLAFLRSSAKWSLAFSHSNALLLLEFRGFALVGFARIEPSCYSLCLSVCAFRNIIVFCFCWRFYALSPFIAMLSLFLVLISAGPCAVFTVGFAFRLQARFFRPAFLFCGGVISFEFSGFCLFWAPAH